MLRIMMMLCLSMVLAACADDSTVEGTGASGSGSASIGTRGSVDAAVGVGDSGAARSGTQTTPTTDTSTGAGSSDAGAAARSDAQGPTPVDPPVSTPESVVAAGCVDGQYSELMPTPEVSIDTEIAGYNASNYLQFIDAVLAKRYPIGQHIIENALLDQSMGHCVDAFLSQKNTADQVIGSMSTLVHECGHFLDISVGGFFSDAYVITESLTMTCSGGSTPSNGGGKTFSRSLIKGDEYASLWTPCASFGSGGQCDSYAAIYLNGDPTDGNFDSGDQGFGSLLEETVQYVNSLATGYAFNDYYSWSTSERDGILTFLWYLQRYLRMARLDYPETYAHLTGDACWREAILTTWGRAWLFLNQTEGLTQLGINDAMLEGLALDAALNEEIQRVRDAHGCP